MDVRREAGMYPGDRAPRPTLSGMFCVDQGSETICATFAESAEGAMLPSSGAAGAGGFVAFPEGSEQRTRPRSVTGIDMDWSFHEGTRRAQSMNAVVTLDDGSKRELSAEELGLTYYFRGGGYFGFRNCYQGRYFDMLTVDGEKLDLSKKEVLDELYGCEEIAASYAVDGARSFGVLEPFAIGELPKYGITDQHLG